MLQYRHAKKNNINEYAMSRQRAIINLIVIPAVVSLLVTLLVLNVWGGFGTPDEQVLVLPTTGPTSQGSQAINPQELPVTERAADSSSPADIGAEESTGEEPEPVASATRPDASDPNCETPIHVVESGDLIGRLAEDYSVSLDDIIAANELIDPEFDPDFIFVGQELVMPVCGLDAVQAGIADVTPTATETLTPTPTRIIPTAIATATPSITGNIEVVIARVLFAGDITQESVDILNLGGTVDLEGWVLRDPEDDEEFEFPAVRIFPDGLVTVYTGDGENTASELYWGLNAATWEGGDTVQLYDADGELQSEFTLPAS